LTFRNSAEDLFYYSESFRYTITRGLIFLCKCLLRDFFTLETLWRTKKGLKVKRVEFRSWTRKAEGIARNLENLPKRISLVLKFLRMILDLKRFVLKTFFILNWCFERNFSYFSCFFFRFF